jgi:hypothetical protein
MTTIHGDGRPLETFTLRTPLEAMVLNDRRVCHDVTPVRAAPRRLRRNVLG